jgi:2-polyprenyl-3-methyl-5-hydroxy-6-metoxy-1,4-benzoquinol methylase
MAKLEGLKQTYDQWGTDYDTFIHDDEKFQVEAAHYGYLFARHGVESVLDAGCGTGRHAVLLARESFYVSGSDLSDGMLEQARQRTKAAGLEIPFMQSAFGELSSKLPGPFDGVLCGGSGLAHLTDSADLRQALIEIGKILRPGGILIADNINFALADESAFTVGPLDHSGTGKDEKLWLRIVRYEGPVVQYSAVSMRRAADGWQMEHKSFPLSVNTPAKLERMLPEVGFTVISHEPASTYGGGDNPFLKKHAEPKSVLVGRKH